MSSLATARQIDLQLHPKQSQAFTSAANEILYGGAAMGGKSHLMRVAAIAWCVAVPGLQVYLFRREYKDLIKNHMNGPGSFPAMLSPWIDAKLVTINWSDMEIRFTFNGSKIFLCHCQHEKDVHGYQGAEIHVLMMDELTHFTDSQYRFLRGRCRIGGLKIPRAYEGMFPRIVAGSNPGGVGHNWVKATFIDNAPESSIREMPKAEGGMKRQFIRALLQDNPTADEDYVDKLEGLGDASLIRAMRDGDWDIVSGGMFDDVFSRDRHVIEPFEIPDSWYIDRSFDWGSSKPFSVGWWAESNGEEAPNGKSYPPGTLFRINEWYGWNGKPNEGCKLLASEIAQGIIEREAEMGIEVAPGPADSSIFDSENGNCIAQDMADEGVTWTYADKSPGSRKAGWEKMRNRFRAARQSPMESPGLFFFDNCLHAIRTIPVLPRDPKKTDDVESSSEDHCFVGDTLVDTSNGPVRIDQLIGTAGRVYGSDGQLHEFEDCRMTRKAAEIVRVTFEDGRQVVCTPDHEVLTSDGIFRPIRSLLGARVYGVIPPWSRLSAKPSKNSKVSDTTNAVPISKRTGSGFISPFGSQQMAASPRATTYITTTTTGITTHWTISAVCPGPNTSDTIWQAGRSSPAKSAIASGLWQPLGMDQKPGRNGIENTIKPSRISSMPRPSGPVTNAEKSLMLTLAGVSARITASLHGGLMRGWIWLRRNALFVRRSTESTNTGQIRPVLDPAARLYSIVTVEPAGKADVYCLKVAQLGNFTIEGGIIVHNCGDETRYRCHTPNVGHAY